MGTRLVPGIPVFQSSTIPFFRRPHAAFRIRIVRQFHDIVEVALAFADVENVHLAFVGTRDGLEFLDAVEFALKGAVVVEGAAPDDFDGAKGAHDVAGQPNLAVAAAPDPAD